MGTRLSEVQGLSEDIAAEVDIWELPEIGSEDHGSRSKQDEVGMGSSNILVGRKKEGRYLAAKSR